MTFGELKKIKQEKGFTLEQLSDYSGVPLEILKNILSGEKEYPEYDAKYSFGDVHQKVEETSLYTASGFKQQGEYTLEDYYAIVDDRRVELIDGVIYDMAAPTFVHQQISGEIYSAIKDYIRSKGGDCLPMFAPVDVRLDCDDRTMVQPDVLILCDKSKICKWGIMGVPDFCLEIVSESTRRKDYIKKLQKYTDAGVKEYWIIDPFRKVLITYCCKDEYLPHVYPLEGKVGVGLYDEELQIDLEHIASLIQEYPDEKSN